MPRGKPLTEEVKERIYGMYLSGMSQKEVGELFDIHSGTVSNVVCEQRRKQEEKGMAYKSQIVVGDKANGRLISLQDPKRYEGTCIVGGKSKRRSFTAASSRDAQQQWEKWCTTLRDEQQFMDMVERKREPEKPKAVCGSPLDPVEEIRTVATDNEPMVIDGSNMPIPDVVSTGILSVSPLAINVSEPAYLIWARSPEPRCYGLYFTMDAALAELDRLNDVARFLSQESAFEVEEVVWRG